MKKNPPFNCVQMKSDLQQQLRQVETGLTLAERKRRRQTEILTDPVLGPWFRNLKTRLAQPAVVAETPTKYRAGRQR